MTATRKTQTSVCPALLRCFQSELTRIIIDEYRKINVLVRGESAKVSAPFPLKDIFRFDEALYGQLNEAYQRGDKRTLRGLWSKAERWLPEPAG